MCSRAMKAYGFWFSSGPGAHNKSPAGASVPSNVSSLASPPHLQCGHGRKSEKEKSAFRLPCHGEPPPQINSLWSGAFMEKTSGPNQSIATLKI